MSQPADGSAATDSSREDEQYAAALEWLFSQTRAGAARSPARMEQLSSRLGLSAPPRVAHVVGTNGKGTVSAMIAAGMQAAGETAGLFISPHVEEYRERITVNAQRISRAEVIEFTRQLRAGPPLDSAFFELTLALALQHFSRAQVSFLALEAGVGARSDATLAIGNTVLTVISSIALDHQDTLGSSLGAIAQDKAAAIRPGVPVVTALAGEVFSVVEDVARQLDSPLLSPATEPGLFSVPAAVAASGTRYVNQRLAAAALRSLGADQQALLSGVSRPPLPGRGEWFTLPAGRRVLLDGAHDPAAARALLAELPAGYGLVYAGLGRKQREETARELSRGAAFVISTGLPDGEALLLSGAQQISDNRAALLSALEQTPPGGTVLVAGSLYLAGSLRGLLSELSEA